MVVIRLARGGSKKRPFYHIYRSIATSRGAQPSGRVAALLKDAAKAAV